MAFTIQIYGQLFYENGKNKTLQTIWVSVVSEFRVFVETALRRRWFGLRKLYPQVPVLVSVP